MKNKIFTAFATGVMLLNAVSASFAGADTRRVRTRQNNQLVALLPASDAVISLDAKRFFNDALPKLLSANQDAMAEVTAKIDELQQKTGLDLRRFDTVAVGFAIKQVSQKEMGLDPVVIARGTIPAGGLVSIAKMASNGTYKEEKIGDHTVYIFSVREIAQKNMSANGNSKVAAAIGRAVAGMPHEIALTAFDSNTLAFGSVPRVRQTLAAKTHIDPELTSLLSRKSGAVANFAVKTPTGLSKLVPTDNDEIGKMLNSIRFLSGWMDVSEGNTVVNVVARTVNADQAQSLLDTLQGLQVIGKAFLGGSKGADKQVYARMIDNVKLVRNANEVTMDLAVPQSDIDILVGGIK